ncbi:MAG: helix-turn-helix domain-containing protein [Actinomycetota bacterium]|nr:helix-turn-helix domain-containing protein [Actinomycetota bacterium]
MQLKSVDQPSATEAPRFYSVAQVAQMFGMSSMTVYRAIAAGEFPAVRIRGRLIVPARAVEAMAEVAVAEHTVVDAAGWVASPDDRDPAMAQRLTGGRLR